MSVRPTSSGGGVGYNPFQFMGSQMPSGSVMPSGALPAGWSRQGAPAQPGRTAPMEPGPGWNPADSMRQVMAGLSGGTVGANPWAQFIQRAAGAPPGQLGAGRGVPYNPSQGAQNPFVGKPTMREDPWMDRGASLAADRGYRAPGYGPGDMGKMGQVSSVSYAPSYDSYSSSPYSNLAQTMQAKMAMQNQMPQYGFNSGGQY